jgi:hypothetical protein
VHVRCVKEKRVSITMRTSKHARVTAAEGLMDCWWRALSTGTMASIDLHSRGRCHPQRSPTHLQSSACMSTVGWVLATAAADDVAKTTAATATKPMKRARWTMMPLGYDDATPRQQHAASRVLCLAAYSVPPPALMRNNVPQQLSRTDLRSPQQLHSIHRDMSEWSAVLGALRWRAKHTRNISSSCCNLV